MFRLLEVLLSTPWSDSTIIGLEPELDQQVNYPMKTKRVVASPGLVGDFPLTNVRIFHQPKSPPIWGEK
jgi:hypothetical protein